MFTSTLPCYTITLVIFQCTIKLFVEISVHSLHLYCRLIVWGQQPCQITTRSRGRISSVGGEVTIRSESIPKRTN